MDQDNEAEKKDLEFLGRGSLYNIAVRMNEVDEAFDDVDSRRRTTGIPTRSSMKAPSPRSTRASLNASMTLENLHSLQEDDVNQIGTALEYPLHTVHEDGSPRLPEGKATLAKPGPRATGPRNDRKFDFMKRESLRNLATIMNALEEDIDDISRKSILQQASMSMSRMWGSELFEDEAIEDLQHELELAYLSDDSGELDLSSQQLKAIDDSKKPQDQDDAAVASANKEKLYEESVELIKKLEKQIESLQSQLESSKTDFRNHQIRQEEERENLNSNIETLQKRLDASEAEMRNRQLAQDEEKRNLNKVIESLQKRLEASESDIRNSHLQQNEERQKLESDIQSLHSQLEERKLELEKQHQQHNEEKQNLEREIESLQEQLEASKSELRDYQHQQEEDRRSIYETNQLLEKQLADLKKSARDKQADLKEEKKRISGVNLDLERIRAEQQKQRQSFQENAQRLRRRLSGDNLEVSSDALYDENESLKKQLAEAKSEIEKICVQQEKDRQHLVDSSKRQEESLHRVSEENESLKQRLEEAVSALDRAQAQGEEGDDNRREAGIIETQRGDYKLLVLQQENEKRRLQLEKKQQVEMDRLQSPSKVQRFRQSLIVTPDLDREEISVSKDDEMENSTQSLDEAPLPAVVVTPQRVDKRMHSQTSANRRNRLLAILGTICLLMVLSLFARARYVSGPGSTDVGDLAGSSQFVSTSDAAAQVAPLYERIDELQSERDSLEGKLKNAEASLVELDRNLKDAKEESSSFKQERLSLKDSVRRLESERNQVEDKLKEAKTKFDSRLDKLEQENTKRIQTLRAELSAVQLKLEDANKMLKDAERKRKLTTSDEQQTRVGVQRPETLNSSRGPLRSLMMVSFRLLQGIRAAAHGVMRAGFVCAKKKLTQIATRTIEGLRITLAAVNGVVKAAVTKIRNQGSKFNSLTRVIIDKTVIALKGGTRRYVHSEQEAWLHLSGTAAESKR